MEHWLIYNLAQNLSSYRLKGLTKSQCLGVTRWKIGGAISVTAKDCVYMYVWNWVLLPYLNSRSGSAVKARLFQIQWIWFLSWLSYMFSIFCIINLLIAETKLNTLWQSPWTQAQIQSKVLDISMYAWNKTSQLRMILPIDEVYINLCGPIMKPWGREYQRGQPASSVWVQTGAPPGPQPRRRHNIKGFTPFHFYSICNTLL